MFMASKCAVYLGVTLASFLFSIYRRRKFRDLWNGPNGPDILPTAIAAARCLARTWKEDARRLDDRPTGRDEGGGRPGGGGVNYCPCIRRSLPIVVDSFVSLVLVACLWQPWNLLSFRRDSPCFFSSSSSSSSSAAAMQKRPRGCPLKANLKGEPSAKSWRAQRDRAWSGGVFSRDNSTDSRESYESSDG